MRQGIPEIQNSMAQRGMVQHTGIRQIVVQAMYLSSFGDSVFPRFQGGSCQIS